MIDQFRDQPREALARFFPSREGDLVAFHPPAIIQALIWMFLPPEESGTKNADTSIHASDLVVFEGYAGFITERCKQVPRNTDRSQFNIEPFSHSWR